MSILFTPYGYSHPVYVSLADSDTLDPSTITMNPYSSLFAILNCKSSGGGPTSTSKGGVLLQFTRREHSSIIKNVSNVNADH